jgi:hypothetical protein
MAGENQIIRRSQSLVQRVKRVVLAEFPARQLLGLATIVGALWAASLFDWDFLVGRHVFWQFPRGTFGGVYGENDMAEVVAAYFYYVQSPWHLPLFYVSALGTPTGVNVIFTDFVPIIGLIGKLIHSITGVVINLYGAYFLLCFILPGVMMTLLLIAAKIRHALATIVGAVFADTAPILLWRWGHVALIAQFLLNRRPRALCVLVTEARLARPGGRLDSSSHTRLSDQPLPIRNGGHCLALRRHPAAL